MAKQTINIGTVANDGTGDALRTAFDKCNGNFNELYGKADLLTLDTANDNYLYSGRCEIADAGLDGVTGIGGTNGYEHVFGSASAVPVTAPPGGTMTNWGADSGYTGVGQVVLGAIGGYDCVVNSVGSFSIGANHSHIKQSSDGHSVIVGGSVCVAAGGRGGIFASLYSETGPATLFASVICSNDCYANGSYSSLISSQLSQLDGAFTVALASYDVTAAAASSRNIIAAANNCDITGASQYSIVTGLNNTLAAASYSLMVGNNLTVNKNGAVVVGSGATSPCGYSTTIGLQAVEPNDVRSYRSIDYKDTNNQTALTNMVNLLGTHTLPAGKVSAGLVRVRVVGLKDGSADGDNDGVYNVATYAGTLGFRWDGTNYLLWDASGTSSANTARAIPVVQDAVTIAAAPVLTCSAGILRVQVSGKATTNIKWAVDIDVLSTLES